MEYGARIINIFLHPLIYVPLAYLSYVLIQDVWYKEYLYQYNIPVLSLGFFVPLLAQVYSKWRVRKMHSVLIKNLMQVIVEIIYIYLLFQLFKYLSTEHFRPYKLYILAYISSRISLNLLNIIKRKPAIRTMGLSSLITFLIGLSLYYKQNILWIIAILIILLGLLVSFKLSDRRYNAIDILIAILLGVSSQIYVMSYYL